MRGSATTLCCFAEENFPYSSRDVAVAAVAQMGMMDMGLSENVGYIPNEIAI